MGFNPANFAYPIGTGPWVVGYSVSYAISFYDAATGRESARSQWWGPRRDPKQLYGGVGLIRIPVDPTGQASPCSLRPLAASMTMRGRTPIIGRLTMSSLKHLPFLVL